MSASSTAVHHGMGDRGAPPSCRRSHWSASDLCNDHVVCHSIDAKDRRLQGLVLGTGGACDVSSAGYHAELLMQYVTNRGLVCTARKRVVPTSFFFFCSSFSGHHSVAYINIWSLITYTGVFQFIERICLCASNFHVPPRGRLLSG